MDTKKYLESIQILQIKIEQLRELCKEMRDDIFRISSSNFDTVEQGKMSAKTPKSPFEDSVNRLIDTENKIKQTILKLNQRKRRIIKQIHSLNNPVSIKILYKRYVQLKLWTQISEEMQYNDEYLRGELHQQALTDFEKKIKSLHNLT